MKDPQQAEYDEVHAQIRERLAELKVKDIPNKLKALIATVRNNHLHPLLREVVSGSENQASFIFNGNAYSIEFKEGSPFSVPVGPRLCSGLLVVRTTSDVVLESKFEATEDEWGLEFYYKDTTIYRRGDWVDELLKLKHESDELRRAQERKYFQSKEQLESLRDKFGLPGSVIAESAPPTVLVAEAGPGRPISSTGSTGSGPSKLWIIVRKTLGF